MATSEPFVEDHQPGGSLLSQGNDFGLATIEIHEQIGSRRISQRHGMDPRGRRELANPYSRGTANEDLGLDGGWDRDFLVEIS